MQQARSEPPEQPKMQKNRFYKMIEIITIVHIIQIIKKANHRKDNRNEEKNDLMKINNEAPGAHKEIRQNHQKT